MVTRGAPSSQSRFAHEMLGIPRTSPSIASRAPHVKKAMFSSSSSAQGEKRA